MENICRVFQQLKIELPYTIDFYPGYLFFKKEGKGWSEKIRPPQCSRPWFNSQVGKIPWRRDILPTPVFLGFPDGSAGKESACNAGDLGLIPGLGRSPGEGKGYPLQYSNLENSMDCIVHGATKSRTQLSNFHFTIKWNQLSVPFWKHSFLTGFCPF